MRVFARIGVFGSGLHGFSFASAQSVLADTVGVADLRPGEAEAGKAFDFVDVERYAVACHGWSVQVCGGLEG